MDCKSLLAKIFKKIIKHKFRSLIVLLLIVGGIYLYVKKTSGNEMVMQYVLSPVSKGSLIISVSGSGQVSASNQIDVKPKVSGDLVSLKAENGQEVKSGELLAQIDAAGAQKDLRDAETSLETAELDLEELLAPVDEYTIMQAENSLTDAQDSLTKLKFTQQAEYDDLVNTIEKANDNLEKSYEDAFNSIANAFLDLPTIITGLRNILYSEEIVDAETYLMQTWNKSALLNSMDVRDYDEYQEMEDFIEPAETTYTSAREKYDINFENYKNISRYSEREEIETLLGETIDTLKTISEVIKREANMLDYWVDYRSQKDLRVYGTVTGYQSDLNSYTSKGNSHLSGLLSDQRSIEDYKEAKDNAERDMVEMNQNNPLNLAAAERTIKERERSLAELKEDPDELDVRAQKIVIQQKKDLLADTQEALANHYIRAPFSGIITEINVKKGEEVSSSTALFTLITKDKLAEITLNEIDIAKVAVGQRVIITFDALDDLEVEGTVAEIDTVGTTSSGVVTYDVRISFNSEDKRIKPGMSLSAEIVTTEKTDIITISSSAIKQIGDKAYVQVVKLEDGGITEKRMNNRSITVNADSVSINNQIVEIGISNDTITEIVQGLEEGDMIVAQTLNSTSGSTQIKSGNSGSILQSLTPGGGGPGGGEMREMRQFTR